jgi:putative hemolysin
MNKCKMDDNKPVPVLKPIVLKDLVAEKNPNLAKKIPGFVYGLLNRLLHIGGINEIIMKYGHLSGIPFVESVINHFDIKCIYQGTENLPYEGSHIFASNHPLGGFDGLLLISGVTKHLGKSLFLVRDELTKIPPLKELFIPINKFGSQHSSVTLIMEAYKSDSQILVFPSGLASRKIKGQITDLVWQKHFIQKSIEYHRNVIPVHIEGKNSAFFYWLANFRKFIGIRFNIEMFLLPDELFKNRGKTFIISFGEPINWQTFDRSKSMNEWAAYVRNIVYNPREKSKN